MGVVVVVVVALVMGRWEGHKGAWGEVRRGEGRVGHGGDKLGGGRGSGGGVA